MRACAKCNKILGDSEFHKRKDSPDGLRRDCKVCVRARQRAYHARDPDKRCAAQRDWYAQNREKMIEYNSTRLDLAPEKVDARKAVYNATKSGRLIREPCEVCGSAHRVEAHHDSYLPEFWLSVRWLCVKHHNDWHRQNPDKDKL